MRDQLTVEERRRVACWMEETASPTLVREKFRIFFGKDPPSRLTVRRIYQKFLATGSVQDKLVGHVGRKR